MEKNLYLRIITGQFGGRELQSPKKTGSTRPMLDRVKESLFDILARKIPNTKVLDLCAGSGQLGLECLSRGAESVVFVEAQRDNVKVIEQNIDLLNLKERSTLVAGELPYALGRVKGPFDLIFFDPPFRSDLLSQTLPRLAAKVLLAKDGIMVVQRDRRTDEIKTKDFVTTRRHRIGDSELWFLGTNPNKGKPKPKDEEPRRDRGDE